MLWVISICLSVIGILLVLVDLKEDNELSHLRRSIERERLAWAEERKGYVEKIMLMKGYREFKPIIKTEEKEPDEETSDWEEL